MRGVDVNVVSETDHLVSRSCRFLLNFRRSPASDVER